VDTNIQKARVIAAYAGTGKTTLALRCPQKMVDFVCMPYKYVLSQDSCGGEACKANPNNDMRPEWPRNYVAAIKSALEDVKTLLIPSDNHVLALLRQENIPYVLCYPMRSAKEIYRKRFLERGNTEEFLEVFIDHWDSFFDKFEADTYGQHIILQPYQFLSDVIVT
jgi:hypothetical protein